MKTLGKLDSRATRESLLQQINSGDAKRDAAWAQFYELYAPIVAGFAKKLGVRSHDTADVVQDVLLGFFISSPRFVYDRARGRFRGYLKTCVWNVLKSRFGSGFQLSGQALSEIAEEDRRVEEIWNDTWEKQMLQQALETVRTRYLSRDDRKNTFRAFEMYALMETPAEEVARELRISVESVHQAKSRVSKAIRLAAAELARAADRCEANAQ